MKKRITAALAALLAFTAFADASTDFKIGPKAGIAASWMPGTSMNAYDKVLSHNSFYAGLSGEATFNDYFLVQAELLYTGKGHSDKNYWNGDTDLWMSRYSLELGYIEVPVYLGTKFMNGQISIMAGPEFGFNVLAQRKLTVNNEIQGYEDKGVAKADVRQTVRPFNIGMGLQVSYEFFKGLGIDAKASWGLNRTFRKGMNASGNISGTGSVDKGHNFTMQFGIFYKFAL